MQANMKRAIFAVLALTLVASSSGCCCLERLFCCGCGPCAYGHEGPFGGCGSCGGCGASGCADCGLAGGTVTGPSYVDSEYGGEYGPAPAQAAPVARRRPPAQGHPMVRQRRNAGGQYEFAAGPPTGGVTYPYYTTRGPRDFLARNPRSIGP